MYKSIKPGKTLYDTDMKRIQAHGGSIIMHNGVYYFYGENKEGVTGTAGGKICKIWNNGVKMYSSTDLYNWKDEGVIIVEYENKENPFHPTMLMDRPHILYNKKDNRFVLWAKVGGPMDGAGFTGSYFAVAVSDTVTGPYKYSHKTTIEGFPAGDFDFAFDGDDVYVIHERPHDSLICRKISSDFLYLTDEYSIHVVKKSPPLVREAPAFFTHNGRKFLLTSGTTGYYPNPTICYEIESMHGEWKELGLTCVDDKFNNSFHAQFSSVFHDPVSDKYIALGDRWLTDLPVNMPDINEIFRVMCDDNIKDKSICACLPTLSDEDTSNATYVWLPVEFDENGLPFIKWHNEWKLDK